ncbi:MAG: hypothetical protein MI923_07385 [Phycisphaerales bacterium]|nr:hypothetical protein [Phycisphaerales bacterium]
MRSSKRCPNRRKREPGPRRVSRRPEMTGSRGLHEPIEESACLTVSLIV